MQRRNSSSIISSAYSNQLQICCKKAADLLSLCQASVIPKSYHSFYKTLISGQTLQLSKKRTKNLYFLLLSAVDVTAFDLLLLFVCVFAVFSSFNLMINAILAWFKIRMPIYNSQFHGRYIFLLAFSFK